jgi:hypothetical protein
MKRSLFTLILLFCSVQPSQSPFTSKIRLGSPKFAQRAGIQKKETPTRAEEGNDFQDVPIEPPEPSPPSPGSYPFPNPAGCSPTVPDDLSPGIRLEKIQEQISDDIALAERTINYVWNGPLGSFVDISADPYVYEFEMDEYQYPFTYQADQLVTVFIQNGFAVWLRSYGGAFRLLAVSMIPGAASEIWDGYIRAYWEADDLPEDEYLIPVSRKLPCRWMIAEGFVQEEAVEEIFNLDWGIPDYLSAGRGYLAETCSEAYRISQEEIGYWDATSMCGPLTWQISHDANAFPYRIGSYDASADLFIQANPRFWGHRPWTGFDPETYDLVRVQEPMAGYEFASLGELNTGDILFSFGSPDQWAPGEGHFSHIFLVAGIDEGESRLAVTNMVKNHRGVEDCFISEVVLYTPGDRKTGVVNHEWNDHGYGSTGEYGFDLFRWKWITHRLEGRSREYRVRWGETIETIAFDWKISPESILKANCFSDQIQLKPGQRITLPPPVSEKRGAE